MKMAESDDELFSTNVSNHRNGTMIFGVKGPHINVNNMPLQMNCNPRNNPSSSRLRYAESCTDDRYRRAASPMSVHSAFDMPRNYNSFYPNFRLGSPFSIRSSESTGSASAAEIALVFRKAEIAIDLKNVEFNRNDLKLIEDAYRKFMRKNTRNTSKTRSLKTLDRQYRPKLRDFCRGSISDLSSSSSDDDLQQPTNQNIVSNNTRSTKSHNKRPNVQKKNIDTAINHNTFGNISSIPLENANTVNLTHRTQVNDQVTPVLSEIANMTRRSNNVPTLPKDRFKKGFDFPCQRFNRSIALPVIQGITENSLCNNETIVPTLRNNKDMDSKSDSEQEHIVSDGSPKNLSGNKRKHDQVDDMVVPKMKRIKNSIPTTSTSTGNDFNFAKPNFPVRKSINMKKSEKTLISSTLLSKSVSDKKPEQQSIDTEINKEALDDTELDCNENTSDVLTRPSFIKRKLFTHKLELTEKKNLSTDSIQSPQVEHSTWHKEKSKPRKYTTSQLCLTSLDSNKDNNNLKDLINKIVPSNDTILNKTNINRKSRDVTQKTYKTKSDKNDEDWDVASVISTCDIDATSDTYTDEEIFEGNKRAVPGVAVNKNQECKKPVSTNTGTDISTTKTSQQKLVFEKTTQHNAPLKTALTKIKSFWDTDIDTDYESSNTPKRYHNNAGKSALTTFKEITIGEGSTKLSSSCDDNSGRTTANVQQNEDKTLSAKLIQTKSLRVRLERTPKRRLCCDYESEKHNKNCNALLSLPKNHKNNTTDKGPAPKNNVKPDFNNDKKSSNMLDPKKNLPNNKDLAKKNTQTKDIMILNNKLKNINEKANIITKSNLAPDIKNKEKKKKPVTPKKNASKRYNSTLDDSNSFNLLHDSKCLRTRTVNLSNSSTDNERTIMKESRTKINNKLNTIRNQNNVGFTNIIKSKKKNSNNRTLLNTSVQTRRSKMNNSMGI